MTTDLTGDFELGEEDFQWDVFAPDPDDAAIAAADALEDEDGLDLDDSQFDWEAALRDDTEPENGTDNGARAGAAYDRIVDTMRGQSEEPPAAADPAPEVDADLEVDAHPEEDAGPEEDAKPVAVAWTETVIAAKTEVTIPWVTATEDLAMTPHGAPQPEAPELDDSLEFEPEAWLELGEDTGSDTEPGAAAASEAEPVWEPAPTLEADPESGSAEARIAEMAATVAAVATVEPAPAAEEVETEREIEIGSATAALLADPAITGAARGRTPAHSRKSLKNSPESEERSRVFTATVVLACLVLVVIAVAAVAYALQHGTAGPTAPPASSAPATARIQTATDAIDSATTSATVGFSSLGSFPTPSNVEKIINPYMSSLQLYGTILSGSNVPDPARADASSAEAQVRQDLQFFDTIDGLPPLQLGAYLKQFDADATQLQTTLSALEQNLRSPAS